MRLTRGDVWTVDFNPVRGHEQAGRRPAVIVSITAYNVGPTRMAVVIPITSRDRGVPMHVRIGAPEGGLDRDSVALCDHIRAVSADRFVEYRGAVSESTMTAIAERLGALLDL